MVPLVDDVVQKLSDNDSFLISTVVPRLSKKFFTFLLAGKIGTGKIFLSEIGGKGIALTIVALIFL